MQPLSGLTVLDFSTLLPGPLATLMLAEAGARVVKVERPGGEDMRRFPPFFSGGSALYAMLNRGKEAVFLDLKTEQGRAAALDLATSADIVVEQFRPGVMDRLGLGYAALAAPATRGSSIAPSAGMARAGRGRGRPATTSTTSPAPAFSLCPGAAPKRPCCRRRRSPISAAAAFRPC